MLRFSDILLLLFRKSSSTTGFRIFKDYFFILLKVCGAENILLEGYPTGVANRIRLLVMALMLLLGISSSFLVVWNYFYEVEEVITSTISFILVSQVICKIFELITHSKSHREMIKIVEEQTQALQDDRDYMKIGVSNFNRVRFHVAISSVAYLSALASLYLSPLYALIFKHEFVLRANVQLPFTKYKEPTGWMINYIFCIFLAGFSAFTILAYDVLFYMYVFHITGRFQILEHQVSMIGDFDGPHNTDEKQYELITKCARLHSETLEFARKCSKLFSGVYFMISVSDFVVICIAFFHLQLDIFASSGFLFIAGLIQCFIFCNCGEIVMRASQKCSLAIYTSYWYRLNRVDQRKMVLMMQTQRYSGLKAGGFTVSLGLFMQVSLETKLINAFLSCLLNGFI